MLNPFLFRLTTFLVLGRWLIRHRGTELTLLPQFLSIKIKRHRYGDEQDGDAAKQSPCVLNAHAVKHLTREEGEASGGHRAEEGVGGDGRGGTDRNVSWEIGRSGDELMRKMIGHLQHQIRIDNVIEELDEDCQDTESGEQPRKRRHDPVYTSGVSSPAEPE